MSLAAANALVREVSEEDLEVDRIYPPLSRIREVSVSIATAVAEVAFRNGPADMPEFDDLSAYIRSLVYEPTYPQYAN